ncbi:hypothetical protein [Desulfocastanea catecholica]
MVDITASAEKKYGLPVLSVISAPEEHVHPAMIVKITALLMNVKIYAEIFLWLV